MTLVASYLLENRKRLKLGGYGLVKEPICMVATPRFRASSHIITLVFQRGSTEPTLVVKTPRLPGDFDRLEREADNLRLIHAARPGGFATIPRLIAFEDYNGVRLLTETALAGQAMTGNMVKNHQAFRIESVLKWLSEVHTATARYDQRGRSVQERDSRSTLMGLKDVAQFEFADRRAIEDTRRLIGSVKQEDIPLVFEHGDLGPPNLILLKEGGFGVIDWELAEPGGLPAVDLFFFLALVGFARRSCKSKTDYLKSFHETFFGSSPWAGDYVSAYWDRLQLRKESATALFVMCWGRYVESLIQRLHDGGETEDGVGQNTRSWLRENRYYTLWRYTLEHIEELNLLG